MSDITDLLSQVREGQSGALGQVFEHLYDELRKIAKVSIRSDEKTLSPTVLIHETYLRLISNSKLSLSSRRHFLACAVRVMRAIWVDHVRSSTAIKRGGVGRDAPLEAADVLSTPPEANEDWLVLDQALNHLDTVSPRQREVVELRYFAGLEFSEIGELLECSERTAKRDWKRARAFLHLLLQ